MVFQKIKKALPYHLSDSTAILAEATPVYAFFETVFSNMPINVSQNARMSIAAMTYLGLGFIYGKGRDLWRTTFNVHPTDPERRQQISDAVYTSSFNLFLSPALYSLSGSHNFKEIAYATGLSLIFGAVNGAPVGYSIDVFRDLTGVQPSERIPKSLNSRPFVKKGIAAALIGASLGLTALIYHKATPHLDGQTAVAQISLEQKLE